MKTIVEYVDTYSMAHGSDEEVAELLEAYTHNVQLHLPTDIRFEARPADRYHPPSSGPGVYSELELYGVDVYVREQAWECAC